MRAGLYLAENAEGNERLNILAQLPGALEGSTDADKAAKLQETINALAQ